MDEERKFGSTSQIIRWVLRHSITGQGLTGLTSSSTGLIISTIADMEATATAYTVAGSNVETIATLGTYAAPTSGKCRFKEVDATNHPGLYEFQFADARFAVTNARSLRITAKGATNLLDTHWRIALVQFDPYDAVRLGLTALPNAAAEASGGLYTRGTGAGQINQPANGQIDANTVKVGGTVQTARDLGASVLLSSGTGTGQISLTSGAVTVGTNNDKTGYTASTVSDKTGYSLANGSIAAATFAAGAIDAAAIATDAIGSDEVAASAVTKIQAGLSTYAGGDTSGTTTLLSRLTAARAGYLDNLSAGAVALEASVQSVLTKLLKYVQLMLRKDAAIATDNATELTAINANGGSGAGAFDNTTDSQEALRDRGDAAWITATGFAIAGDAMALTAGERDTLTDAIVDQTLAGHTTAGTVGGALNSASSAGDPWNTPLPGSYASGTAGKIVGDNLDATVNSRLASASYTAPDNATISTISTNVTTTLNRLGAFTGSGVNTVLGLFKALLSKTASTPSDVGGTFDASTDSTEALRDRGDVAWTTATGFAVSGDAMALTSGERDTLTDAMVDQTLAGHTTAGTVGGALNSASSAGDPWSTALPGSYSAGQAGKIVGDNLNATVNSRLASASYTAPDNATISTIDTNVSAALNRLGAFTGTGLNTILGFFRALLRKDAGLTPSDVGGTYDNTTDSQEAAIDNAPTGGDTPGTTTLLTRIVGTLASGTHQPQSGDVYPLVDTEIGTLQTTANTINTKLGTPVSSVSADIAAVLAALGGVGGLQAETAYAAFPFHLVQDTDHNSPATGITVTAELKRDTGTYAALAGSVVELSNGDYYVPIGNTEIPTGTQFATLRFSGTGAATLELSVQVSG